MAKGASDTSPIAPALAAMLDADPAEPVSVLIEADVPSARARLAPAERPSRGIASVRPLSPADERQRQDRLDALRALLVEVSGSEPRLFKHSNAFGAALNAAQVRQMARSPLVRAIRENRRLAARS